MVWRDLLSLFLGPFHLAIRKEAGLTLVGSIDEVRTDARRLRFLRIKGVEIVAHRMPDDPSCAFLTEMPWLRSLRVFAHPLSNLEAIQSLLNLQRLTIQHIGKTQTIRLSFEPLKSLTHLTIEWFRGAEGLFKVQGIETLNLSNYQATSSKAFSSLASLRCLRLANSQIIEIDSFVQMQQMQWLALLGLERLADFSGIAGNKKLRFLWIEGCPNLHSLEFLHGMEELETLRILDCGPIAGIDALAALPCLRHLFIRGDTTVVSLDASLLRRIPHLESVVVNGLPSEEASYWAQRNQVYDLLRSDLA
jgi:hypothetical protein